AAPEGFVDPAPPKVQALAPIAEPAARKQEELTFHAAPKPLAAGAVTHDWRTFLGPTHNAISTEKPLLQKFGPKGPAPVWEMARGEGYATPAVIGQRVVLFHRVGAEEVVECLQAETGQRFWRFAYPTAYNDRYGFNGGPRCQPVSDGEFVYTLGAEAKLHCLKLTTGQLLWKRDLRADFKLGPNFFGMGATPLLEGGRLIVNVGATGGPTVAGFDARTGKMAWGAGKEWGPSYASPIPATVHGKRRVFVFAGGESRPATGGLMCVDPADGKLDFSLPWRSRTRESVNASSPVVVGNSVYISECYGPGGTLLNVLPNGGFKQAWSNNVLNTHFVTAIHKDGYLYGIDGHGPRNAPLVCIELATGKEMWREEPEWETVARLPEGPRKYVLPPALASLLLVDGRCLLLGQYGHLAWLDLNPKAYKELDRTHLFLAQETWSMPALSRGLLYVNQNDRGVDDTRERLICYDLRAAAM
ncbi:MAG: PQQ-binding-like beta-propeller repeat protein, partial [Actinomycetota bacterium]